MVQDKSDEIRLSGDSPNQKWSRRLVGCQNDSERFAPIRTGPSVFPCVLSIGMTPIGTLESVAIDIRQVSFSGLSEVV